METLKLEINTLKEENLSFKTNHLIVYEFKIYLAMRKE